MTSTVLQNIMLYLLKINVKSWEDEYFMLSPNVIIMAWEWRALGIPDERKRKNGK